MVQYSQTSRIWNETIGDWEAVSKKLLIFSSWVIIYSNLFLLLIEGTKCLRILLKNLMVNLRLTL